LVLLVVFVWRPWANRGGDEQQASPDSQPAAAVAEPAWLSGTLSVAQTGDAEFRSIVAALRRAGPGATIEVLDDATYNAAISIADAERLRDLTLVASLGAKLTAPIDAPVIKIAGTPGVAIRGFQIDAFHGQHGIEITGPCPGVLVEDIMARRIPNPESPALVNFAYLHAGAAGTKENPIVIRKLTLRGGGHGLAIGELAAKEPDLAGPVRWVRIEECTIVNPESRTDYCLFLLNDIEDVQITHNTFADSEIGISVLMKQPNQGRRISIDHNTFYNLGSLITLDANLAQDQVAIVSNLISRTDRVTPGQLPVSALPTPWFSQNAWLAHASTTDPAISSIATPVDGIDFESEDSAAAGYLVPTADSIAPLQAVGSSIPGRYSPR
jgi:hypothetical protein